jgi:hypothetical protein
MRQSYDLPQDNGSRRSHQCPSSHHKMALRPKYVQASAWAPQPSQPSTGSSMLLAQVSPYHQQGSAMPSAAPEAHSSRHLVPFASMGGGSPQARLHDCSQGLMAPLPMYLGASTPLHPPQHFIPFVSMGGECTLSAGCLQPLTGATRNGCQGSMAPSPITSGVTRPSPSLAHPFLPTRSSPTQPLPTMGGSAPLVACRALERSHQRLASTMSKCPGFADANPWVMETINAVALELQCWYQRYSIR